MWEGNICKVIKHALWKELLEWDSLTYISTTFDIILINPLWLIMQTWYGPFSFESLNYRCDTFFPTDSA